MQRAIIIGSPGTGKTTFARKLAEKTGLQLIHLDYYYHDDTHDYQHDKQAWHARVRELIAEDRWIMDGNYNATMAERMERADTIFYFAMPRTTAMWGTLKRRAQKPERPDMPESWKESVSIDFLKHVWFFEREYANAIEYLLHKQQGKQIITFKTRSEVDAYLKGV
jgi:adenylate kinase family enzyme